ncbi:MAG: branched-chain amino acid ABC transporter permease [Actinobacteria bacterium]|nr:branched-chain amino acid ABC transporter permease [Actinomycetota bacterium]
MAGFEQSTLNGLMMGSLYGLIALGLSLVFGVMKIINFAHGALLMVGMFTAYWLWVFTNLNPYLLILLSVPILFFFGYYVQHFLVNPLLRKERGKKAHSVILMTSGLVLVLENLALFAFGPNYRMARTVVSGTTFKLGEIMVSQPRFYAALISIVAIIGLHLFLTRTDMGKAIRATGQDREAARLMGIDDFKIYKIAFGIGMACLGVAGNLLFPFYYVQPAVGPFFEIRSFVIVVLGGIGSLGGSLVGGLIIGLIESVGAQFVSAVWTELIIMILFIAMLLVKPSGLLGRQRE